MLPIQRATVTHTSGILGQQDELLLEGPRAGAGDELRPLVPLWELTLETSKSFSVQQRVSWTPLVLLGPCPGLQAAPLKHLA